MKKTILTLVALSAVASVMAQGTVSLSTRITGIVVGHVYLGVVGEQPRTGNTASETPAGVQTYAGANLQGTGFYAQLFGGPLGTAEAGLIALGVPSSFRTGATLGGTPALQTVTVPSVIPGGTGTFQVRAWDNAGGTINSWDLAAIRGQSDVFSVSSLGDGLLNPPANMDNFRSFNITAIPEPATFVLAGLGAAALLIFRRRK